HTRFSRDWSSDVCSSDLCADSRDALTPAKCSATFLPLMGISFFVGMPRLSAMRCARHHDGRCGKHAAPFHGNPVTPSTGCLRMRSEERRGGKAVTCRGVP